MSKYASLRELIADLERIYELPPSTRVLTARQAADCLRVMATALREIAWLPDTKKTADADRNLAKHKAQLALKVSCARVEDFNPERDLAPCPSGDSAET